MNNNFTNIQIVPSWRYNETENIKNILNRKLNFLKPKTRDVETEFTKFWNRKRMSLPLCYTLTMLYNDVMIDGRGETRNLFSIVIFCRHSFTISGLSLHIPEHYVACIYVFISFTVYFNGIIKCVYTALWSTPNERCYINIYCDYYYGRHYRDIVRLILKTLWRFGIRTLK